MPLINYTVKRQPTKNKMNHEHSINSCFKKCFSMDFPPQQNNNNKSLTWLEIRIVWAPLKLTVNRYSVVFKAQPSCKTFYWTASHSEETWPPHQGHSCCFSPVSTELSKAVTCPLRPRVWESVNKAESVKKTAAHTTRTGQPGHFLFLIFQTGIMRSLSHQALQMLDLTQDMGFKT